MFFRRRCCRRPSLLTFVLLVLGFKMATRERMSESDLEEFKEKRRLFRSKMREAFDVWENEKQKDDSPATEE